MLSHSSSFRLSKQTCKYIDKSLSPVNVLRSNNSRSSSSLPDSSLSSWHITCKSKSKSRLKEKHDLSAKSIILTKNYGQNLLIGKMLHSPSLRCHLGRVNFGRLSTSTQFSYRSPSCLSNTGSLSTLFHTPNVDRQTAASRLALPFESQS